MQWLKILLYQSQALGPSYSSWSSEEEHLGTTASAGVGYAYMGGAELGYLLNTSICVFGVINAYILTGFRRWRPEM